MDCGSICCFCPETTLQVGSKLAIVEHGMDLVERGSKVAFNASILFGGVCVCVCVCVGVVVVVVVVVGGGGGDGGGGATALLCIIHKFL